jgi:hypothetical protein
MHFNASSRLKMYNMLSVAIARTWLSTVLSRLSGSQPFRFARVFGSIECTEESGKIVANLSLC